MKKACELGTNTSNSRLRNSLENAIKDFKVEFPDATISHQFLHKLYGGIEMLVYVLAEKHYSTSDKMANGFVKMWTACQAYQTW